MYSTIMVNIDPFADSTQLLAVVKDVVQRFDAHVIGIAASQPIQVVQDGGTLCGEAIELDRTEVRESMKMAEEKFRSMLGHRTRPVEWRSNVSVDSPSSYVAHQARSADLVMTGVGEMGFSLGGSRRVDTSDLIMQLGRPVMIVPDSVEQLRGRNIVIGWKNTREARRVTVDALPWLKQASRVTIIHIVDDGAATSSVHDGVEDVAGWLHRHGIDARGAVVPKHGDSESQLEAMARAEGADLIVAGAYGHSRLKEWVLGGMTADLLLRASICSLMSH